MLSEDKVKEVANLAKIDLQANEIEAYCNQLAAVMKYFENISEVDAGDTKPLIVPTEIPPRKRDDLSSESADQREEILTNAPERFGMLYKVPPVV